MRRFVIVMSGRLGLDGGRYKELKSWNASNCEL
jgi:hypothetical protein